MTTAESIFTTVDIPHAIPEERVRSLLCGAFEGGSNYWAIEADYQLRDGLTIEDFKEGGSEASKLGEYCPALQIIPFVDGCSVSLKVSEEYDGDFEVLNWKTMETGLHVMATKYPRHFQNFVEENDDCETADVFLQCCLFGEIIFG